MGIHSAYLRSYVLYVSLQSLCLVKANVIGNMQMIDMGMQDDKIIAVAAKDPSVSHITSMSDMPPHFLAELRNFFEQYKVLENKKVVIDNFQEKEIAYSVINEAIALYKKEYSNY